MSYKTTARLTKKKGNRMYCQNCGKEIDGGSKYCGYCGTRTSEKDEGAIIKQNGNPSVVESASVEHTTDPHECECPSSVWYKTKPIKILSLIALVVVMLLMWQNNLIRTTLFVFMIYQLIRQMPDFLKNNNALKKELL